MRTGRGGEYFDRRGTESLEGLIKLLNEEPGDLKFSSSMIRIIKSKGMKWSGHVAKIGRRGTHIDYW
jgi:hypothetical protein